MKFRFNSLSTKSALSALIFSMGVAVSAPVLAESKASSGANAMPHSQPSPQELTPEQQAILTKMQSIQQELQTIQQTLQGIQQQAFEKNPAFVKQQEKLQATVFKKMSNKDYNAETEVQELKTIANKYQDGKTKPTQEEIASFRQRDQDFQQRQQKAFQDPEVQKMSLSLKKDVEKAMLAIDPKTKELMEQMETKSKKFMELRQKMAVM